MESQKFGHQHPLVFNQSDAAAVEDCRCSRCGEAMLGPSYSCADCDFWLHKECAEAPEEINHPLHRDHPLCLLPTSTLPAEYKGRFSCNFCGKSGEKFVYHCSCYIDLHIKCALFTSKFPEINNNFGDLKQGIIIADKEEEDKTEYCLGCWEPLLDSASYYYSLDHGFKLHQKCIELSFEIRYPLHHNHLLTLQFSVEKTSCVICHNTSRDGFSYSCSLCNFSIHIACHHSFPSVIQGNTNQHPFTLISRLMTFTCDACGVEGNTAPYMSTDRNLLVHKKCISLPPVIKFIMHEHLLFHSYFLHSSSKSKNWDCVLCLKEVNTNHGSYHCSECSFILHVNCALENEDMYSVIESVEEFNKNLVLPEPSYIVVERNEDGEATTIKHFTHQHNMTLSDKILIQKDYEFCDGCTLPILESYYSCSECKYFLHKTCAEFPKTKYIWFLVCEEAHSLSASGIFKCDSCERICNGFSYDCPKCYNTICLRCVIHFTLTRECEGHLHPLAFYLDYEGRCTGCHRKTNAAYICKICKEFALCESCNQLPSKAQQKCDEHLLALTYHEDNDYSETHFCDICEEDRKPDPWFYSCATCDTSAHPDCVLRRGKYPFVKPGKIYEESDHQHPVRFVKKKYYYPKCIKCDEPCQELALECTEPTCDYIHWECICSDDLKENSGDSKEDSDEE